MNLKNSLLVLSILISSNYFAQSTFLPGFYLVNKNAKYAQRPKYEAVEDIFLPYTPSTPEEVFSYGENISFDELSDEFFVTYKNDFEGFDNKLYYKVEQNYEVEPVIETTLREGQVVLAFMVYNNRVFCFDMKGHQIVFSGLDDLTKAPETGSIGFLPGTEELMEGPTLQNGYYWILSQNTATETVKIQLSNSSIDIKSEKITFWKKHIGSDFDSEFEYKESSFITIVK